MCCRHGVDSQCIWPFYMLGLDEEVDSLAIDQSNWFALRFSFGD